VSRLRKKRLDSSAKLSWRCLLALAASSVCLLPSVAVAVDGPAASLQALEVAGFLPALLFVPSGTELRPLIVAAHGAGGTPEWECEYWRRLTNGRNFVLCLRGTSMGKAGGFYYRNEHALEAELTAAERAARAAHSRISKADGVYAGFSQGASMGSAFIARHGSSFPRVVLIEGFERWNIARARAFAKSGGQRVLFVCGSKECNAVASDSARWLAKGGVEGRVELAVGAGHTPAGAVMQHVEAALPWVYGSPE
jgi:predicted esterase